MMNSPQDDSSYWSGRFAMCVEMARVWDQELASGFEMNPACRNSESEWEGQDSRRPLSLVHSQLRISVSNLLFAGDALLASERLPMFGPTTVLRTALLCGLQGLWILQATGDLRMERTLRFHAADLGYEFKCLQAVDDSGFGSTELAEKIRERCTELEEERQTLHNVLKEREVTQRYTAAAMLADVREEGVLRGDACDGDEALLSIEVLWNSGSADAHGHRWQLGLRDVVGGHENATGSRFSDYQPAWRDLGWSAVGVAVVLMDAMERWNQETLDPDSTAS